MSQYQKFREGGLLRELEHRGNSKEDKFKKVNQLTKDL